MNSDLDETLDTSGLTLDELNELLGETDGGPDESVPYIAQESQEPERDPGGDEAGAAPADAGTEAPPFQFLRSPRSRTGVDLEYALFLDLETVPDESRLHLFGLPDLPDSAATAAVGDCPDVAELLKASVPDVKSQLLDLNPCSEYLDVVRDYEKRAKAPRKGVFDALEMVEKEQRAAGEAEAKRAKLLSTTPEFCRIVAIGSAAGASQAQALVTDDERAILRFFWDVAEKATHFIGWNVLHFDLPVLLVRSMILGVEPTCVIDRSPWSGKVIDLMQQRFGRVIPPVAGRMKDQARLHGIDVPAGDTHGGDVLELWKQGRHSEIAGYVCSDVEVGRELFHRMSGYWFM